MGHSATRPEQTSRSRIWQEVKDAKEKAVGLPRIVAILESAGQKHSADELLGLAPQAAETISARSPRQRACASTLCATPCGSRRQRSLGFARPARSSRLAAHGSGRAAPRRVARAQSAPRRPALKLIRNQRNQLVLDLIDRPTLKHSARSWAGLHDAAPDGRCARRPAQRQSEPACTGFV